MNAPSKRNKITRWDRLRRKHINNLQVKTEIIKKFIEIDFIGKDKIKQMNGSYTQKIIDPILVMDLRHEMFKRIPRKKISHNKSDDISLENVRNHNQVIEDRFVENELTKFKTELKQNRPKTTDIISKTNVLATRTKLCLDLSNKALLSSLDNCGNHLKDFYMTSSDAIEASFKITNNFIQNKILPTTVEVSENSIVNLEENKYSFEDEDQKLALQSQENDNKCVRFEDSVEIISYSREHSIFSNNTINDDESVISDESEKENKFYDAYTPAKIDEQKLLQKSQSSKVVPLVYNDILTITKIQQEKLNEPEATSKDESDMSESSTSSKSEDSNNEQNAIITELFRPKFPKNELLLRKYFLKWIHFVTLEKIEKQNNYSTNIGSNSDRIHKINAFLDTLRREKVRISTNKYKNSLVATNLNKNRQNMIILTKKYKNKIKIQQDIIELQKLKLERQERMIMQLKLSKLSEEARKAREEIKSELKSQIRIGNHKNRSKAKCLQIVGNLRDAEDEEFERLQGRSLMTPKFLQRMQERALERNIKHEQARHRRLQLEAEREAAKMAAEEAKRLEDEEAKRQRIEALKEKRRQEKLAKILKERERQKCVENNHKSLEFHRRFILRRIGLEAFKRLLKIRKSNQRKAILHRKRILKLKIFTAWKLYYNQIWENKKLIANQLYMTILKRTSFRAWTSYMSLQRSKYLVAIDWHELKLTEFVFQRWLGLWKLEKIIEKAKIKQALSHYHWHLKWKVLDRWTRLPQILKLEKETEERRQRWRMKIWELLPDYEPNREDL